MFFEESHSVNPEEFSCFCYENFSFPLHIHRAYEFFLQQDGETEVTVDGVSYLLKKGDAVLIFPFQTHSYNRVTPGKNFLCFFSPELVADFHQLNRNLLPLDNRFEYPNFLPPQMDNIFLQRSFAYSVCGIFHSKPRHRTARESPSENALIPILLYAEQNFNRQFTLRDAAQAVGYSYTYVSKYFKKKIGLTFNKYINLLRINRAKELLLSTSMSIAEIKDACGFRCIRTFNREFALLTSVTPTVYRNSAKTAID